MSCSHQWNMRKVCVIFGLRILEIGVFPSASLSFYHLDTKLKETAGIRQEKSLHYCVKENSLLTTSHLGILRK